MEATTTIVIYRQNPLEVISEVFKGEKYYLPTNGDVVDIFEGTLEEFLTDNPEYNFETNN